jgi:uncharacterized protein YecT (DUF1311 family)
MVRIALLLPLVVAAVCTGLAVGAGGAPVIKEPFTRLPCPKHPSTTLQLEGCAEKAILGTDAKINSRVAAIYASLSSGARAKFASSESTWLKYRRSSCDAQASKYAGGTFEPVAYARCEVTRNKRHLADLSDFAKNLRP